MALMFKRGDLVIYYGIVRTYLSRDDNAKSYCALSGDSIRIEERWLLQFPDLQMDDKTFVHAQFDRIIHVVMSLDDLFYEVTARDNLGLINQLKEKLIAQT